jgi:HD-like signal output (HDOD) protein
VAVANSLRLAALKAADRLPGFSVVLPQALSLCAREDVISIAELASVIEGDVVISGSMLSLANSAFYSRGEPIATLRQSIARLGIRKTRNVLLGLSVMRSINRVSIPSGWSSARFNGIRQTKPS